MFTVFIATVAAAVFVMYIRNRPKQLPTLDEATSRPIARLREGVRGRIVGITQPPSEPLIAPFSGKPCVYYAARVERVGAAAGGPPLATETAAVAFVITDETGRALIDPTDAKVTLEPIPGTELAAAELTAGHRALLARHDITPPDEPLRYSEALIAIGEAVAVVGAGTREPDPDAAAPDYRGAPPTRLRLAGSATHPLFITDDP